MNNSIRGKTYLTPNQVAELLMVSPAAVRLWAQKGELHALITPGGHRRFLKNEIDRFARARGLTLNSSVAAVARLLIVDDDEQIVRYLVKAIGKLSDRYLIDFAHNGFNAGLKVKEFQPEVVLLDLMMPGLDGFEVCNTLKTAPATKWIRIIAMTGFYTKENKDKVIQAGAEYCLEKPVSIEALEEVL